MSGGPRWWTAGWFVALASFPAVAENPYTYAKFSLGVPWLLYFVFLGLIAIPFAVMMLLAWRRESGAEEVAVPEDRGSGGASIMPPEDERPA